MQRNHPHPSLHPLPGESPHPLFVPCGKEKGQPSCLKVGYLWSTSHTCSRIPLGWGTGSPRPQRKLLRPAVVLSAGKGALGHVVEERGCELYLHLETTCHGEGWVLPLISFPQERRATQILGKVDLSYEASGSEWIRGRVSWMLWCVALSSGLDPGTHSPRGWACWLPKALSWILL